MDQLNAMRKTYSKLRPFFVGNVTVSGKIPGYCYENYLDCFRLIYEYVTYYTQPDLLDAAYLGLDNSYMLDSFVSVTYINRIPALNDFNILSPLRPYYKIFLQACILAMGKIYSYMSESCKSAADIFIHESAEYLKERIVHLHKCNNGMPFHDRIYDYKMLPLDNLILYNTFWKDYIMIPQKDFMDSFKNAADSIDPVFGRLQLAFELIGIDFSINGNKETYGEIIRQIRSAGRDVDVRILITHLLREIYHEKPLERQPGISEPSCYAGIGSDSADQKRILDEYNKSLQRYIKIASGRSDNKLWDKGLAENLTYQFIYRNYFELDRADIIFIPPAGIQNATGKLLERYGLKLVDVINADNCRWLNSALENAKGDHKAYKKYMNYKISYSKEFY